MEDAIIHLGTKGSPSPSSSVLQLGGQTILIDCGIGAARALVEADIKLTALDAIFITQLHSDHLLDLGPLIYTAWTTDLVDPLTVYGPPGLQNYWTHFLAAMSFDHGIRTIDGKRNPLDQIVQIQEYSAGVVAAFGGLTVTALRVDHPPSPTALPCALKATPAPSFSLPTPAISRPWRISRKAQMRLSPA